jgi:hypothetical protein
MKKSGSKKWKAANHRNPSVKFPKNTPTIQIWHNKFIDKYDLLISC